MPPRRENLEQMFLKSVDDYIKDKNCCIDKKVRDIIERHGIENSLICILGAKGSDSCFSQTLFDAMKSKGISDSIIAAVDDFQYMNGRDFNGVEIISCDKLVELCKKHKGKIFTINTLRYDYARRIFENLCLSHEIPYINFEQAIRIFELNGHVDYRTGDWGDTISAHPEKYVQLANRFADSHSAVTLFHVLLMHLHCNLEWTLNVAKPYSTLYFRSGLFHLGKDEKMVDCGASIGESTCALIDITKGQFAKSWMIEPDRYNTRTLQQFVNQFRHRDFHKNLFIYNYAVGETSGRMPFCHVGGHGGNIIENNNDSMRVSEDDFVNIESIDNLFRNDSPTIIKMDIEGAELSALKGAKNVIERCHPKLMVSVYHRDTDLISIPDFITQLVPEYNLGLRHHTENRWDTCLYAWKDN